MSGFQSKRLMRQDRLGNGLTIDGLTIEQVKLLDRMWQFEELEELEAWAATLRPGQQRMVDDLIKMVLLSHLDQILENEGQHRPDPYPEANAYLKKFRLS
jgi:hypothetical protein